MQISIALDVFELKNITKQLLYLIIIYVYANMYKYIFYR